MKPKLIENAPPAQEGNGHKRKELTEAMKKEQEDRAKKCGEELGAILKKHDCALLGVPKFQPVQDGGFRVIAEVVVIAK